MVVEPGEVMNHLPLLLVSSQAAADTSLPAYSLVCTEMLWLLVPVIDAQPLASTSNIAASNTVIFC